MQVQRFLGHADPGFTLRFTYVGLVDDQGVIDAVLFDDALSAPEEATRRQPTTHTATQARWPRSARRMGGIVGQAGGEG